jgi:transposase
MLRPSPNHYLMAAPLTTNETSSVVKWLSANGWSDKIIAGRLGVSTSWIGRLRRRVIS